MKLHVVEASPEFVCGTFGPLAVSVWEGAAGAREAEQAAQMLRSLGALTDGLVMLAILGPNAPPASNEVREIISKAVQDLGPKVRASATVIEGQGFRAAAMRAALVGMSMVIRAKHPQKSFASVGEAATFLSKEVDDLRESHIVQAVSQLRQR